MTIEEYRSTHTLEEQKELAKIFHYWLSPYTQSTIDRVWVKMEKIINDDTAMELICNLYALSQKEKEEEIKGFVYALGNSFDGYDVHSHNFVTTSDAYRQVLYDLFIKE